MITEWCYTICKWTYISLIVKKKNEQDIKWTLKKDKIAINTGTWTSTDNPVY
jgi:hypothetical protein